MVVKSRIKLLLSAIEIATTKFFLNNTILIGLQNKLFVLVFELATE